MDFFIDANLLCFGFETVEDLHGFFDSLNGEGVEATEVSTTDTEVCNEIGDDMS